MTDKTMALLALNFLFGAILLCRVGFQIYKRKDTIQRYQRVPSSATYPTLTFDACLLYTSPSPRDLSTSRMPSSA